MPKSNSFQSFQVQGVSLPMQKVNRFLRHECVNSELSLGYHIEAECWAFMTNNFLLTFFIKIFEKKSKIFDFHFFLIKRLYYIVIARLLQYMKWKIFSKFFNFFSKFWIKRYTKNLIFINAQHSSLKSCPSGNAEFISSCHKKRFTFCIGNDTPCI